MTMCDINNTRNIVIENIKVDQRGVDNNGWANDC